MDINFFKKEKIAAMKERNKDAINAYDLIVNKILMASIDKRAKGEEIVEADIVSILQKCEKELIEEQEGFKKAGREDSVKSLDVQIETVRKYLPKLMSAEEIKAEVLAAFPAQVTKSNGREDILMDFIRAKIRKKILNATGIKPVTFMHYYRMPEPAATRPDDAADKQ